MHPCEPFCYERRVDEASLIILPGEAGAAERASGQLRCALDSIAVDFYGRYQIRIDDNWKGRYQISTSLRIPPGSHGSLFAGRVAGRLAGPVTSILGPLTRDAYFSLLTTEIRREV